MTTPDITAFPERRWSRYTPLLLALACGVAIGLLVRIPLERAAGPGERAEVSHAVDGDTILLRDGRTVRLIGLDAPETTVTAAGAEPFAAEATRRLDALVAGRDARLEEDAEPVDAYGRLLRHVWIGRNLVAETLLREGLARVLRIPPNGRHADRLQRAEDDARAARRGVWSVPEPTPLPAFALLGPAPDGKSGQGRAAVVATGTTDPGAAVAAQGGGGEPEAAAPIDPSRPCGDRVAGAMGAEEAGAHVGSFGTVEFRVITAKDTGRVTYLNSHDPYQGHFYAAVFPGDYARFPSPPAALYAGRCVVVRGEIETFRGAPEIVLADPDDIRVVGD